MIYTYTKSPVDTVQLYGEIQAAGLPVVGLTASATQVFIDAGVTLTSPQISTLNTVVSNHVPIDASTLPGLTRSGVTTGYIDGLILSNSSAAVLGISSGCARDSSDSVTIPLVSNFTKTLQSSGVWGPGSNNNGLDTGARTANTWYHVFLIARDGGGAPDILFSLSPTAPTLPGLYTLFRRIGSVHVNVGTVIDSFTQDGDEFSWVTRIADLSATNPGTAAATRTLTVPTGVRVQAKIVVGFGASAIADNPAGVLITDLATTDVAPSVSDATIVCYSSSVLIQNFFAPVLVWTNTSAQVRSRLQISSTNTLLKIITAGWIDPRGKR